jgi:hypothetical protein
MRELVARPHAPIAPGTYLIGAGPGVTTLTYQQLRSRVEAALDEIRASQVGSPRP